VAHFLVDLGMTVSVLLFGTGYVFRRKNNRLHRILNGLGMACNLASAVVLLVAVHAIYGGDARAAGFVPGVPGWVILSHRILATVTLLMMLAMGWTGIRRNRTLHIAIHRFFIPSYLIVYISGLLIFQYS